VGLPLTLPALVASLLIVFGAGAVRGFAGFGFSALCVAGMSLYLPPAQVVPPVFMLEVLASLSLLRGAWKHVDWRWLGWLVAGNALCIPLGVALLAFVAETPLRALIGCLLLAAALLLRSGWQLGVAPGSGLRLATGLVSGLVNGVAAIGGIAVAVMLSAAPIAPAAMRATMIYLFLFTDLYALAWAAVLPAQDAGPLLGAASLSLALWLAPAMLAGIWIGQRRFASVSPQRFRRGVLNLLAGIAAVAVLRALLEWRG
jgi:uncharacterized membrane protein YfcA